MLLSLVNKETLSLWQGTRAGRARLYAGMKKGRVRDAIDLPETDAENFTQ